MGKSGQRRVRTTPARAISTSTGLRPSAVALAVATCFSGSLAIANPTLPTSVAGVQSITGLGTSAVTVHTNANAIINWQSFSIGVNELTKFIQPSALSAVLNRVQGQDPSSILGALQSNGRVFLINPNGITFGAGAQIDVAGLVASTLKMSDDDFLNNRMRFTDGAGAGSVINQGAISATGGPVYMVGNAVTNNGIITNPGGEVVLAAGNSVELVNPGTPNLRVEIVAPDNEARNLGTITAEAGRIGIYAGLVSNSGTLNASSAVAEGGRILLKATKNTMLASASILDASGVGGGRIDVLANDTVYVDGRLDASAPNGGNGGFIDTSGKSSVKIADSAVITTNAPQGQTGTWLIDPTDFVIANGGGDAYGSTIAGFLSSTNVIISSDGGPGGPSSGGTNGDILVNDYITWTSENSLSLMARRNITINGSIDGGGDLRLYAGWNGGSTVMPVVTSGVGDITSTYDSITTKGNVMFQAGRDILLGATNVWAGRSNLNGVAADSLAKSVKLSAGRNVALTAPDGGTYIWATGNNRSSATVLVEAQTGSVTIQGSTVSADGGSASNGATGGGAVVLVSAGDGINVSNYSIVKAQGGYSDSGPGGAAAVTMLAGGNILIDGSEGSAFGASGTTGGSAAVTVVAGGNITVQGNYSDGLRADAGASSTMSSVVLAAAGDLNLLNNARIDTDGVAGLGGANINLNNADVFGGTGIALSTTGNLDMVGGSYIGTNSGVAYVNTGGNVTVNSGSRIYAPDVTMSVGGVINMNDGGTIGASLPSTIDLTFPLLTSGGYFVNGVEGVVYDEATSTGFCSPSCPAVLGSNLLVTYGAASSPSPSTQPPTDTLIVALVKTTEAPAAPAETGSGQTEEEKKEKENTPVCR